MRCLLEGLDFPLMRVSKVKIRGKFGELGVRFQKEEELKYELDFLYSK